MIRLNTPADDDPALDQSKLLHALRQTIRYADEHGGIGLTQTKAFNRKFAHWAADHFDWPDYSIDKLLSIQKVLNEWDVPPVGVIHDVLTIAKWGRHTKGEFKLSKSLSALNASRGKLFVALVEHFLFSYNHDRFSRSDFTAPGNWDIFLNIINVEAQLGLTEAHLVKTLYGLDPSTDPYDREFQNHKWFLVSNALRPLTWIGFLAETRASEDRLADRMYWKTPLWSKCLLLDTDRVKVIESERKRQLNLVEVGSDQNYLAIHLALIFGLHKHFEQVSSPVPGLLIIDQISRPYYPKDEKGDDEVGLEDMAADEDRRAMEQIVDFIFTETARAKGLQVLLIEHAFLENDTRYVGATIERWTRHNGTKLIPDDWPERTD